MLKTSEDSGNREQHELYLQEKQIEEEATKVWKKIRHIMQKRHDLNLHSSMLIGCCQEDDATHEFGNIYYRCRGQLFCRKLMGKKLKYPVQTWERVMDKAIDDEIIVECWNYKPMIGRNLLFHTCLWYEFVYISF